MTPKSPLIKSLLRVESMLAHKHRDKKTTAFQVHWGLEHFSSPTLLISLYCKLPNKPATNVYMLYEKYATVTWSLWPTVPTVRPVSSPVKARDRRTHGLYV